MNSAYATYRSLHPCEAKQPLPLGKRIRLMSQRAVLDLYSTDEAVFLEWVRWLSTVETAAEKNVLALKDHPSQADLQSNPDAQVTGLATCFYPRFHWCSLPPVGKILPGPSRLPGDTDSRGSQRWILLSLVHRHRSYQFHEWSEGPILVRLAYFY